MKKFNWHKNIFISLFIFVFLLPANNLKWPDINIKNLETKSWRKIIQRCDKLNKKNSVEYPRTTVGTILVTKDNLTGFIPFVGHVGIILDQRTVVQAGPFDGVYYGPNDWDKSKITCYAAVPKNLDSKKFIKAANWASKKEGSKYNFNFFDWKNKDADKFYCSQLVWAAYYNTCEFDLAPKKQMILFPADLINDDLLTEIIYFKNDKHEKK